MPYKAMWKMKDSGVPWIGEIPEEWKVIQLSHLFTQEEYKNVGLTETNVLSLSYGKIVKRNVDTNFGLLPASFETYNIVSSGNIILRLTDLQNDKNSLRVGLVTQSGIITSAYITLQKIKNCDVCYLYYLLHCYDTLKVFYDMGNGVRQNINFSELSRLSLLFPPVNTQSNISIYLDTKTSQIDHSISLINQSIEKLKEYRQSLITEAVTKGLDQNVEMKDSGVKGIGEIPRNWEIKKFKHLFSFGRGLPITKADLIEEGHPVVSYGQIHSKENISVCIKEELLKFVSADFLESNRESILNQFDFVFADTSEDLEGVGNFIFNSTDRQVFAGYHSIICRPRFELNNNYFAYLFLANIWRNQIRANVAGIKVFSITQEILKNSDILVPPIDSQEIISTFLDQKCSQIDSLVSEKQKLLEKLTAYKKSLIYEYVTGKAEVPA